MVKFFYKLHPICGKKHVLERGWSEGQPASHLGTCLHGHSTSLAALALDFTGFVPYTGHNATMPQGDSNEGGLWLPGAEHKLCKWAFKRTEILLCAAQIIGTEPN